MVPSRYVCVLGDLMTDVLVRIPYTPVVGSDTPARVSTHPGGAAGNVAAWLASLDVETEIIGRIGRDPFGDEVLTDLARAGVTPHLARDTEMGSGVCVVLVTPDGERTMFPDLGANSGLQPAHLPDVAFRDGGHLHLSGYSLLHAETRIAALGALDIARRRGMTISIDASSVAPLREVGVDTFLGWCHPCDVLFANAAEARELTGSANPEGAARAMLDHARVAVVKDGAEGAYAAHAGLVAHRPALAVDVIDTTGAGDAFTAGFLAGWVNGASVEDAVEQAVVVAAKAVSRVGGRP